MLQMRKNLANGILAYISRHYQTQDKREFYLPSANIYDEIKQQESSLSGFHFVLLNMSEILDRDFDIRGGRLIYHTKECLEFDLEKLRQNAPYKKEHYDASFKVFMAQKVANIHLLQAFLDNFAKKGEHSAKSFIKKYFSFKQEKFLQEYNIDDKAIKSPISRDLLDKIIATLNEEQSKILNDKSPAIMIYAGPGSGKTKTLVHKMAHLLTKEDKKSENFLMLAHSRVAVCEFRWQLQGLLGEQARGVKILTFHSFALKLLAHKIQDDKELDFVISQATQALQNNQISLPYTEMLMLDEYQDINKQSYEFIKAIFSQMSGDKQIIAVGDDDQLIMEFNGAKQRFIQDFASDFGQVGDLAQDSNADDKRVFSKHTLSINYRSGGKIIDFINAFRQAFLLDSLKRENLVPNPSNKNKGFISLTQHKNPRNAYCNDTCAQSLSLQEVAKHIQKVLLDNNDSSIALLLRNNVEVLSAQYELENLGIKTACLLETDKFEAGNLIELWEVLELLKNGVDKEVARDKIMQKYAKSSNLEYFKRALALFEGEYEEDLAFIKAQKSTGGKRLKDFGNKLLAKDFETFLSELKFEEIKQTKAKVIIATMHKAKGKEFDIVFVGIKRDFVFSDSSEKRLLYVAFSRAKKQLHIHAQGGGAALPLCAF